MLDEYNFGTRLLNNKAQLSQNFFIETSEADFGLDEESFPNGLKTWDRLSNLKSSSDKNNHLQISQDQGGHGHGYWKKAIPRALEWHRSTH